MVLPQVLNQRTKRHQQVLGRGLSRHLYRGKLWRLHTSVSCHKLIIAIANQRNWKSVHSQCASLNAVNQFPAEEVRRALGDRIQLTENQVQV